MSWGGRLGVAKRLQIKFFSQEVFMCDQCEKTLYGCCPDLQNAAAGFHTITILTSLLIGPNTFTLSPSSLASSLIQILVFRPWVCRMSWWGRGVIWGLHPHWVGPLLFTLGIRLLLDMAAAQMAWLERRVWTSRVATTPPRARTPSGVAAMTWWILPMVSLTLYTCKYIIQFPTGPNKEGCCLNTEFGKQRTRDRKKIILTFSFFSLLSYRLLSWQRLSCGGNRQQGLWLRIHRIW